MSEPTAEDLETLRPFALERSNWRRGWLFIERVEGRYAVTDHLKTGAEGAIAVIGPNRLLPGDQGWIGTGSNRFVANRVIAFDDAPEISFALGTVETGGFHISKHNLHMHADRNAV